MKTKPLTLFIIILGLMVLTIEILINKPAANPITRETSSIAVKSDLREETRESIPFEESRAVHSVWLKAPTPSAENTIKLSPPPPPVDPDFLALRDNLQQIINEAGFNVAVSITDLQNNTTIDAKGNQSRLPGCIMNFFVLLSVVMDLQNGLYPESEVGQLISDTIWGSNAVTAHDLLIKTGGGDLYQGIDKINNLLASLGLQSGPNPALFDHPPAYPHESRFGRESNVIAANQTSQALAKLYKGEVLSPQWRDYFLEKLTGVKPGLNYLIPAGVGAGARVSHKNGFFWDATGWVDNDIGIVEFERNGRKYAYAISLYMEQIPTKYADIPTGQTISRMVWEYFSNKYQ